MQALTVASKLDWSGWIRGLVGAVISGGAGGIGAATAVTAFDPSHDIVGYQLMKVAGLTFGVSGVISLMKYLQTHPTPEEKTT